MATSKLLQPLGQIVYGNTNSSSVGLPNDTGKAVGEITLTKGVWLIVYCCDFSSNANGYRQIAYGDGVNPQRQGANTTVSAGGSKETYLQLVRIISTDGGTIDYYARQNSGSTITAYPYCYAVLIGNR